jgi:ATP-dependent helicase HrpA
VPGLREDLAVALLKSLPKATRRHFVPTPDHAAAALAEADPSRGSMTQELARVLHARTGIRIAPQEWDVTRVPDHLRITFSVEGAGGRVVARGKDLDALRERAGGAVRAGIARAGASIERAGLTGWSVGTVPATFEGRAGGQSVVGFPALVDEGATVALRVLPDRGAAEAEHRRGVRRLLLLNTTAPWKRVLARLTNAQKLSLADNPHGSVPALLQDCLDAAVDAIVAEHVPGEVRTPEAYEAALAAVRTHSATRVLVVVEAVEPLLALAAGVRRTLEALERGVAASRTAATRADVRAQLESLLRPGFVAATGVARLRDVQRYLRAMQHRLERAATNPREPVLQEQVDGVEAAYADLLESLPATRGAAAEVTDIGWMIEELRVSLFAQTLGTAGPISEKRVRRAIADVAAGSR